MDAAGRDAELRLAHDTHKGIGEQQLHEHIFTGGARCLRFLERSLLASTRPLSRRLYFLVAALALRPRPQASYGTAALAYY